MKCTWLMLKRGRGVECTCTWAVIVYDVMQKRSNTLLHRRRLPGHPEESSHVYV